jgi:hypothetical protein
MSYHADVMRAFSRRRFSTSCWRSSCGVLLVDGRGEGRGGEGRKRTEPFSAVAFRAASSCERNVLLAVTCSWRSWGTVSKKAYKKAKRNSKGCKSVAG